MTQKWVVACNMRKWGLLWLCHRFGFCASFVVHNLFLQWLPPFMSLGKYDANLFKGQRLQVLPFASAGMWCGCSDICCWVTESRWTLHLRNVFFEVKSLFTVLYQGMHHGKIFHPTVLCKRRTYRIVAKFWMIGGGQKENVKILCFNWRKIGWYWCLNKCRKLLCWLAVQRKVSKSSAHGATKCLNFAHIKLEPFNSSFL